MKQSDRLFVSGGKEQRSVEGHTVSGVSIGTCDRWGTGGGGTPDFAPLEPQRRSTAADCELNHVAESLLHLRLRPLRLPAGFR